MSITKPKMFRDIYHDWAGYTWRPITLADNGGLKFHKDRLDQPLAIEDQRRKILRDNIVLICPEVDLLNHNVKDDWLEMIEEAAMSTSFAYYAITDEMGKWTDSCLFPWCSWGAKVSCQAELMHVLEGITKIDMGDRPASMFLVFGSLKNEYRIPRTAHGLSALEYVDWIIVKKDAARVEDWRNVETLLYHARSAGCAVYFEEGLQTRPTEPPLPLRRFRGKAGANALQADEYCEGYPVFVNQYKQLLQSEEQEVTSLRLSLLQ